MHFYDKDGEPRHFVEMTTKRGLRPTRISDAKKAGWIPSVTTILNVFDKSALTYWKVNQHLMVAHNFIGGESYGPDAYIKEIRRLTELEMDKAPSAGTDVHNSLEQYFLGEKPESHIEICQNVGEMVKQYGDFTPEQRFASPLGFAGMVDLNNEEWVIDFKTKQTKDKFKPGKMAYVDHARQLSAYRVGLSTPKARCANIFICIENGELDFHEHKQDALDNAWLDFEAAIGVWQRNNYMTAF